MTTKNYLIELEDNDNAVLELAINEIINRIPSFVYQRIDFYNGVECLNLTIICRDFDMKFVETMLAPFI